MEKITLTKNDIKKEALQRIISSLPEFFIVMAVSGLPFILFLEILKYTNGLETFLLSLIVIPLGILSLFIVLYYLYYSFEFILIYKGKYSIKTAVLGNKQEQIGHMRRHRIGEERYQPPKLFFPDNMIYEIRNDHKFYRWTKVMPMTGERVFETSDIGEEFYLITIREKKPKILLIYNTQYFEYKD